MEQRTESVSEPPPTLEYAHNVAPQLRISRLVTGVLAGLFLLTLGGVGFVFALGNFLYTDDLGQTFHWVVGCMGIAMSLLLIILAIAQLVASFASMWSSRRTFWWDNWLETIGHDVEERDE